MRVRALCLTVLVVTAACAPSPPPADEPSHEQPEPISLGVIVGAIDPCALLGTGEAEPQPEGTWACTLGEFHAAIIDFSNLERYAAAPIAIDGVVAYQLKHRYEDTPIDCRIYVPLGAAVAVEFEYDGQITGDVTENHCAVLRGRVRAGIGVLAQNPDTARLLNLHGDDDSETRGACAHLALNAGCQPHRPVPVPDDPEAILSASIGDPHLQCSVFAAAVARVFDDALTPVVRPGRCYFVRPDHLLQMHVLVVAARDPSMGCAPWAARRAGDDTQRVFRGRPIETFASHSTFGACVSPGPPGLLAVEVRTSNQRGVSSLNLPEVTPKDRERVFVVLDQVFAGHFA